MYKKGRENSWQSGILYGHISLFCSIRIVYKRCDVTWCLEGYLILYLPTMASIDELEGLVSFLEYIYNYNIMLNCYLMIDLCLGMGRCCYSNLLFTWAGMGWHFEYG